MSNFLGTTVGKKMVVAVTGALLFGFVLMHMLGNLKAFMGMDTASGLHHLDIYARFLREFAQELMGHGGFLWFARGVLLLTFIIHLRFVYALRRQNQASRPVAYGRYTHSASTYASRSMWWTGSLILIFVIYHILHMTTGQLHFQGFEEGQVYRNVVRAFQHWHIAGFYLLAMCALAFHLFHGVWSLFQTLGLDNPECNPRLRMLAKGLALVLFFGFISVPLAVFIGILREPPVTVSTRA